MTSTPSSTRNMRLKNGRLLHVGITVKLNAVFREGDPSHPDRILLAIFGARQRQLYEAELLRARKEAEQLSEVVRRSSDAIIRFSKEMQVETWNQGAQQDFRLRSSGQYR